MRANKTNLDQYDPPPDFEISRKNGCAAGRLRRWGEKLTTAEWDRVIAYRNIKGEPFETAVWKIRAARRQSRQYHRGQIRPCCDSLGGSHRHGPDHLLSFALNANLHTIAAMAAIGAAKTTPSGRIRLRRSAAEENVHALSPRLYREFADSARIPRVSG